VTKTDQALPPPLARRGLLIVSLPRNDAALAKAARDQGADLLKVHVNVKHRASGTSFGPLKKEMERLEAILELGVPAGIVPGQEEMVGRDELPMLRRFAFLDAYLTHLPLYLYEAGVPVVPAIPYDYPVDALVHLRRLPGEWAEASIVHPEGYGRPPILSDLVALARVGSVSGRRLIVPTQRRVEPDDLGRYFDLPEVWAIMIGAVVTGTETATLGEATRRFRDRLNRLFG
jgi:hypothetical protein